MTPELIGIISLLAVQVALFGFLHNDMRSFKDDLRSEVREIRVLVDDLRDRMTRVETVLRLILGPDKQHLLSPIETASVQDENEE